MKIRQAWLIVPLVFGAFAVPFAAGAQQPKKIPQIGYLTFFSRPLASALMESFRQGLRELGYSEGQNITIEYRYAAGKRDRLPDLAAELVRLKADIILAPETPATQAAKNATKTTPIIFVTAGDPVGSGLVTSLARPGGNVTGLSLYAGLEISGKRLQLLKEAFPKLTHVAVLADPTNPPTAGFLREAELAARLLDVQLRVVEARDPNEFDGAFSAIKKARVGALLIVGSPMLNDNLSRIVAFAASNRLPAMYPTREFGEAGGLMSYSPSVTALYRRAAYYVDKILKGAKPADLPVEQPTKFELVINLKTAEALGLTIPNPS